VLYINLDTREDRKASIEKQIAIFENKHRIPATRVTDYPENTTKFVIGTFGCTKSHLDAVRKAKTEGWPNVLILEDDVEWTNIDTAYPVFEKLIQQPYDVIMLGATYLDYDKDTYKLKKGLTSGSYIVNKPYYDTLINKLAEVSEGKTITIDTKIDDVAIDVAVFGSLQRDNNWRVVVPPLMMQRPGFSNIKKHDDNYHELYK
jgi:GR25 family glycosyltransferase involved in LPS biosynthesis